MFGENSFHEFYEYAMYIALFGMLLCSAVFFWPTPKWVANNRRLDNTEEQIDDMAAKDKRLGPAVAKSIVLVIVSTALASFLIFFMELPAAFSFILGIALVAMVFPTINNLQAKREHKKARLEALGVAEFVAGRMSAQAPLFESLENLYAEYQDGKRELELVGEDLGELIRRVRLGNDLPTELHYLTVKFEKLHPLRQVWTTYRLMALASMGQEAEVFQANDLSESQTISEELANVLETEMSTATMSRVAMFLLIGGMILFLIFFGDDLGDVLVNTLPGNGIIGFSLFALWLAQVVGTKLEELPSLEF